MFEIFRGFVLGVLQIVSPIPLITTDQSFHLSVKKKKSIIKKSRSFSFLESVCIHHNHAIPSISSPEPAFALVNTKNEDSGQFQTRKSANHGLPTPLRKFRNWEQQWLRYKN